MESMLLPQAGREDLMLQTDLEVALHSSQKSAEMP
jgi:hypothetical protein